MLKAHQSGLQSAVCILRSSVPAAGVGVGLELFSLPPWDFLSFSGGVNGVFPAAPHLSLGNSNAGVVVSFPL